MEAKRVSFESGFHLADQLTDNPWETSSMHSFCGKDVARLVKSACHYFKFGKDVAKLVKSACHYFKIGGP